MVSRRFYTVMAAALLAATGCAPNLTQRLQLVAVWPASGESLPVRRHTFELTFNAALDPRATSAAVLQTDATTALPIDVKMDATDPRRLTVRLADPRVGSYRLRWHAVATDSRGSTDGEQSFVLKDETVLPARLDVTRAMAKDAGQPLDLTGNGFAKNSTVKLTMGDDDQPLAMVDTDDRGSFEAQPKVLASIPFGVQPINASDDRGHTASAAVDVRWGGWPPAIPIDVGASGPGSGQVTFTVTVRNRSDYVLEHITLIVKDPDGARLVGTDPASRREDHASVWDIATLARGLAGPFGATYTASGPIVSQAWMEFRHRPERGCTQNCPPAFISNSAAESDPVSP